MKTGKFHEYGDECDCIIDDVCSSDIKEGKTYWPASVAKVSLCTRCIICDSPVELTNVSRRLCMLGNN